MRTSSRAGSLFYTTCRTRQNLFSEQLDGFLDTHGTFERFFFLAVHLRSHYHEQAQTELKVVIIGDYGVGKTSFIKRHINGFLSKKFLKEHGCHVVPMMFSTNKSTFLLQVATLL
jgi:hypothetical protein